MIRTTTPSRFQVLESAAQVAFGLSLWTALLLYCEMIPKNESPRDTMRLVYTMAYFGSAIALLLHLRRALPRFVWRVYQWRYEDAPPEIEKAVNNLAEAIEFAVGTLAWIFVALVSATGLVVLHEWFPLPGFVRGLVSLFWWAAVVALVIYVYGLPGSAETMFRHFRFLTRQAGTSDTYRPRELSDLWTLRSDAPDRSYKAKKPNDGFLIGNRAWTLPSLRENVIALGAPGSGKTSCVMNAFLENLIASSGSNHRLGGLILDYKGDYFQHVVRLCQRYARTDDLVVLGPQSGHCWNPLDSDETAQEVAARWVATMKALGHKDNQTSFFFEQSEMLLENAIILLRLVLAGSAPPSVNDIHQIINDYEFLDSLLEQLATLPESNRPGSNAIRCRQFFVKQFFDLPDEVRQSVVATLNNMLNPLCNEKLAGMTTGKSTFRLDDCTIGSKILYLDLPQSKMPRAGRTMALLLKQAMYAEVKKKPLDTGRYSFMFADEFHEFFTTEGDASDARFFAVSRQYDQINIVATQTINGLSEVATKPEAVLSFLACVKSKIFLRSDDQRTNEYASELFGKYVAEYGGSHMGAQAQAVPRVTPSDIAVLRRPKRGDCDYCESFIFEGAATKVDIATRSARWPVHLI